MRADLTQTSESSFLSLQNVKKIYPNGEKAVHNFNLDINKNEFIVIVGPSGCGKSTTLRMIAGLEDVSEGEIYMEGELLNYKPCKDRRMAIVFQSYALYPQMNVFDNIAFPLTINKYPMPVVNKIFIADREIRYILKSIPYNKFIGVLYNLFTEKGKRKIKIQEVASIFNITEEAGRILFDCFMAYKGEKLDELHEKEEEVCAHIQQYLTTLTKAERAENARKGIKLDEDFNVRDEQGDVIKEMRKLTPYEIKTRVYETAEKLDLTPYLDKLPKELSGGQMQRVALGRAIIKNVPVFLMDEPLSNLDAKLRLTMRSEIVKLHNRINATTIYVTHDQTEAMTMATRIVVMSRGFIQQIGTPERIYNSPDNIFVAKFIGTPAINILNNVVYDQEKNSFILGENIIIHAWKNFQEKYKDFYQKSIAVFESLCKNFDKDAQEFILRILSVTNEQSYQLHKKNKIGLIRRWKERLKKHDEKTVMPELQIAETKLTELRKALKESEV